MFSFRPTLKSVAICDECGERYEPHQIPTRTVEKERTKHRVLRSNKTVVNERKETAPCKECGGERYTIENYIEVEE